jgi:hypothetical protein|tara:strand:+ start:413 stop:925 length:513 start_codon:yes stop_codon:yes gene_type:complete
VKNYFIVFVVLFFSCTSKNKEPSKFNTHPKASTSVSNMYAVEICAIYFNESDFNLNTLGTPYPVVFRLFEDNKLIWKEVLGSLRGKHSFRHNDATKILSYNKNSTYRIVIKDDGLITFPDTWGGGEWEVGVWPFDNLIDNKLQKGSSWIEVKNHHLPNMNYRRNMEIIDS